MPSLGRQGRLDFGLGLGQPGASLLNSTAFLTVLLQAFSMRASTFSLPSKVAALDWFFTSKSNTRLSVHRAFVKELKVDVGTEILLRSEVVIGDFQRRFARGIQGAYVIEQKFRLAVAFGVLFFVIGGFVGTAQYFLANSSSCSASLAPTAFCTILPLPSRNIRVG